MRLGLRGAPLEPDLGGREAHRHPVRLFAEIEPNPHHTTPLLLEIAQLADGVVEAREAVGRQLLALDLQEGEGVAFRVLDELVEPLGQLPRARVLHLADLESEPGELDGDATRKLLAVIIPGLVGLEERRNGHDDLQSDKKG